MKKDTVAMIELALRNDPDLTDIQRQGIMEEIRRKNSPRPKLITAREVCEILGISKAKLSILCKQQLIARIKYSKVGARYYLETIEYYKYHGEAMPGIEALQTKQFSY